MTTSPKPDQRLSLLLHIVRGLQILEELNARIMHLSHGVVFNPLVNPHAAPAVNRDLKPGRRDASLGHMEEGRY